MVGTRALGARGESIWQAPRRASNAYAVGQPIPAGPESQTGNLLSTCLLRPCPDILRASLKINEGSMKADIHPQYATATVRCACGNTFVTRSTQAEIHTDICAQCHPFFTGKQKLVDTAGRVERFRQKYKKEG